MANQPVITAIVKITAKDINGNNVQKVYNSVYSMMIDYNKATINVVDTTGSFYHPISPLTSFTYTIVSNPGGSHTAVMS